MRQSARPDPAAVSAAGLMALSAHAPGPGRELTSLAERPGSVATRRRGQGHEIREIRAWSEGDDARHLDAAASARLGSPQLRLFHEDRERSLILIADFRRPMLWGTGAALRSVIAARGLALAGWEAMRSGGSVGAIVLGDEGPEAQTAHPRERGMALVAACLERGHERALKSARAAAKSAAAARLTPPLDAELRRILPRIPRGAAILLATGYDLPGPAADAVLISLAQRGALRLALVEDRFEQRPPDQPLPVRGAGGGSKGAGPDQGLDPGLDRGLSWARFTGLAAARSDRADRLAQMIEAYGGRLLRFSAATTGLEADMAPRSASGRGEAG